jgi:hypothetical protein
MALKIMLVILCFMVIILSIIGIEREKAYKKLANEWAKDKVEKFAQTGQIRKLNGKCDYLEAKCAELKALVERMQRPLALENLDHREAEKFEFEFSTIKHVNPEVFRVNVLDEVENLLIQRKDLIKIRETERQDSGRHYYKAEITMIPYKEGKQ